MEKMDEDHVYMNVPTKTRPNKGVKGDAPQRRSKVTVKRVALVVLSLLLLAAVSAVIGHIVQVHLNSTSKNKAEKMGKATTAPAATEIKTTQKEMTTAVTTSLNSVVQCDTGWELIETKCYYFSPQSLKLNWTKSRELCLNLSGDLVKIESREEQVFLDGKARELMTSWNDRFWIGLTDTQTEGQWRWTDGSPLDENVAFWTKNEHNTEPDNWKVEDPGGENCSIMGENQLINGLKSWYDVSCKKENRAICEKLPTRPAY